jgi:hypothetical protein
MADQIPGVPEGWELVRIGPVGPGEFFVDYDGKAQQYAQAAASIGWVTIIRKTEKPAKYRPFANADEYMPQADRKISRVSSDSQQMAGFARSTGCDSLGLWMGDVYCTWDEMLDRGHVFLDDGTPFGVRIDE